MLELLPRYAMDGPRYTSYPTAPTWSDAYGAGEYRQDLAAAGASAADPLSLYVHVPFCESLCHFCACNRVIVRDRGRAQAYLDSIERELDAVRGAMPLARTATQLHWGGGTPTWLPPDAILRLYGAVTARFPLRDDAEVSIEVDPRITTREHVAALAECGFNRISLGVQDFDPRVQEAIHRIQPAEQTATLVEWARGAGFQSVNFDLIYGLPYQRPETFDRSLDALLAIGPDRIALYSYAHVTWVARQQRGFERKDLPEPSTKLAIMMLAIRRLLAAGYQFIGLDHFARPDDELARAVTDRSLRRNFMGHTTQAGVDLLGFGPSAISELRGAYAQSQREVDAWQAAVTEGGLATLRGHRLTGDDRERRWIISQLMCHGELDAARFEQTFGRPLAGAYAAELEALAPAQADGLVTLSDAGDLRVTPAGRLLVRNVAMVFDAYLSAQRSRGERMFSRTV